jgi:serine protease inhibitor
MKKLLILIGFLLSTICMRAQDSAQPLESIYQKLSFTLFNKVAKDINENAIFSPFSAQIALSMLENGAAGNTLSEIQEALGTTGYDMEQVNAYNQMLTKQLTYRPHPES